VFFDVFRVFCVFCGNTAKHSQNTAKHQQNITKHPQNTTKHHKTHLLTKQPEFANKPALARLIDCHLQIMYSSASLHMTKALHKDSPRENGKERAARNA